MIEVLHLRQPDGLKRKVVEVSITGKLMALVNKLGSTTIGGGRCWGATTLPLPFFTLIMYNGSVPVSPLTRVHEFVHVRQIEKVGWFRFLWRYIRAYFKTGYDLNLYEIEAYSIEAEQNGLPDWAK